MSEFVTPGTMIADKPTRAPYSYVEGGKTYAAVMGIYDEKASRFIPLEGAYLPNIGDQVLGIVEEERTIGYIIDLGGTYKGLIFSRGLRTNLAPGDIVAAEISEINEVRDINLQRPHKLNDGEVINISPTKVPRVIGKNNSMLSIIEKGTGCDIFVGRNGLVWLRGRDVKKAIETVKKVEREAHIHGLTDKIKQYLE